MIGETERKAVFTASPMVEGFLSCALEDLQLSENEEACLEDRESRDSGTIYNCPDATFLAAVAECKAFERELRRHLEQVPKGALAGFDLSNPYTAERAGSDLYLERAGHGASFQDRDHWSAMGDRDESRAIGEVLSAAVCPRGTLESYIGDDGAAYFVGRERAA